MSFDDIPESIEDTPVLIIQPPSIPAAIPVVPPIIPDPIEPEDALSIFQKKFAAKLEERRLNEAEIEKTTRAKAHDDLQNWTAQRDVRLNAKKESNRSEEQVLLESIQSEEEVGNAWERVTKLIDISAEADTKKSDVSRMKKLLIQLKNEPIKA
mmetsp:Transcript_24835/g.22550  ORF Transcript_24835/g.22550 Transcript_24835/m.22550 type:complete len:154 (+) Transcript_24835:40-501(+)|eukprot:CAMPEP_0196761010 /NCGR_PEP_ID=MMETSP1095-20130614/64_1 /TAXON_ID=96789 ORGANISM="Chromulina nebulosa, Strain UTEXLB2642" /NCGR_SAMPLE_ID=MMETSP1095 /ASSEMBLY_ACC=CAM_ASM_000446 /LENGTH=153 /DNA_ID=CAMNT_0042109993 /DNA_START=28 /DNA_END=489 /DNA_ORIENTATION=+